jgi:hypothetical protein
MKYRLGPLILLSSVTLFVGARAPMPLARAGAAMPRSQKPRPNYLNVQPEVNYVGSKACASCHKEIYDQFVKTEMGRSMSLPEAPSQLEKVPKPVTIYDKQIGRYFQVARQGSELYQSEYSLDTAGEVLFKQTEKIAFVGAGANGFSYLVQRGDYVFQAPLSF